LDPPTSTPGQQKARLKTTVSNADLESFKEILTLRTATETESVRSRLADLLNKATEVMTQAHPLKTSKEQFADSGITPDMIKKLGCEIKVIIEDDGMAVACETL